MSPPENSPVTSLQRIFVLICQLSSFGNSTMGFPMHFFRHSPRNSSKNATDSFWNLFRNSFENIFRNFLCILRIWEFQQEISEVVLPWIFFYQVFLFEFLQKILQELLQEFNLKLLAWSRHQYLLGLLYTFLQGLFGNSSRNCKKILKGS